MPSKRQYKKQSHKSRGGSRRQEERESACEKENVQLARQFVTEICARTPRLYAHAPCVKSRCAHACSNVYSLGSSSYT